MLGGTTLYLLCVINDRQFDLLNEVVYTSHAEALRALKCWQGSVEEPLGIAEFRCVRCHPPGWFDDGLSRDKGSVVGA